MVFHNVMPFLRAVFTGTPTGGTLLDHALYINIHTDPVY